jgi:uncharacterized protein YecE (DUF72 family)
MGAATRASGGRRAGTVRIGCSGWSYPDWRGRFYDASLPAAAWFDHYATRFDTVEINNSFYQLPSAATIAHWAAQAPAGFLYALKASRYLTHFRKLKDPAAPLRQFVDRVRGLKHHLGPILYQLPPHWRYDRERLREFLALLPADLVHVFEFRNRSWMVDDALALLDAHGASLCVHDLQPGFDRKVAVGQVAYVRFHGTAPGYAGGYSTAMLRPWARWLCAEAARGRAAFAYFNNDVGAAAPHDAEALRRMVQKLDPMGSAARQRRTATLSARPGCS